MSRVFRLLFATVMLATPFSVYAQIYTVTGTVSQSAPATNSPQLAMDGAGGKNGLLPEAGVFLDKAGNVYGTTYYGGSGKPGDGLLFKLTP